MAADGRTSAKDVVLGLQVRIKCLQWRDGKCSVPTPFLCLVTIERILLNRFVTQSQASDDC